MIPTLALASWYLFHAFGQVRLTIVIRSRAVNIHRGYLARLGHDRAAYDCLTKTIRTKFICRLNREVPGAQLPLRVTLLYSVGDQGSGIHVSQAGDHQ